MAEKESNSGDGEVVVGKLGSKSEKGFGFGDEGAPFSMDELLRARPEFRAEGPHIFERGRGKKSGQGTSSEKI
ncbi:MAG: hypothetical protein KKE20_05550 [Nanoarchaeota archaeon]|nr:hypothetical protein [Nanoarchaeota archaeon]